MGLARLSIALTVLFGFPAAAHEFWIAPEQYQVQSGATMAAALRNGQNFSGTSLGWFENRFSRFEMVSGDRVRPVTGRMGDTPALQAEAPEEGLLIVLHETTEQTVTYREWDKFLSFVDHKDFSETIATHDAMDWPKDLFREAYTRHAKALIAVGDGEGSDRAFGMETEFTALTNPYAANFDYNMKIQLTYRDAPRADSQVEVFDRAPDGQVAVSLHRTDESGMAVIPVLAGHEYLFDAVVLRPSPRAGTSETAPVWETLWAALTFAVPPK